MSASTPLPLRVAIIGAGQVADKVHASYYATRSDVQMVAVMDSRLEQAQAFAERYAIPSAWQDAHEMLQEVKPDLVSVCSPNRFHFEHVMAALEAGCHVMCEKPPAMTPHQADEMRLAARKAGKVLAYDFHHRFALDTQLLRDAVMNGTLGEIYFTSAQALRRCGVPGWGVFTNKSLQGGGPLIDIGIHMLDAAMYVLGFPPVKRVTAHSFQRLGNRKHTGQFGEWDPAQFTVEDALFGTIEFCNGGILRLDTSFALNIREQSIMNVSFCGEKAGATLFPAHIYNDEAGVLQTLTQREEADGRRHLRSMDAFVRHVMGEPVIEEETPEFAAINIRTGVRQKVASALAEHHIVADIAWAVVAYWQATHDDAFMRNEGLTLLMETASFWMGRATEINGRLEIHDVIGPDEYTEHVNNNAYTNYLAWHNVACARQFMAKFGREDARFTDIAGKFLARLWLPEADAEGVIPQDDTFMAKPAIDLSRYKAKAGKQTILLDYSRAEVNEMQILKQADVVMLNYLLPERFTPQQCAANLAFYEPRTIHDSSLSKAIHGIVLARCGDTEGAYAFWRDGIAIDLGDDPHSSDDGIHAAATGAIWLGAIQGFAGLHISDGELHLAPKLPAHWQKLAFPLRWRGATMHITCEDDQLTIETTAPVTLTLWGKTLHVSGRKVCERKDFLVPVNGIATTEGRHDA
ncbi:Gfo/Idh/MocA family oxidoreductase [Enterobacter hormaechei]|nr:Gfo/Idh/MocA family oxidoreductase [Enterobacter hormaechei]MBW9167085.1 Gfo/Idh/MocA family oxidoreductase [Enterobacter hormaechei]MCM8522918.1 Gfo/Idh/MocA family oxidoreductase [Enterobacter hormaechei]MDN7099513.1 Gfo/Idh/MocA family oxidoreductase [Enterobacter hormaechei]QYM47059.1 Gfo/Idh/MocA family oxidoreductase [Enterobacter hormaechei]